MSDARDGKRGKKSRRAKKAKRDKRRKRERLAVPPEPAMVPADDLAGDLATLSKKTQAAVIELQRTELSRLLREQRQLNERIDRLLQLHEREQVLRQQLQAALERISEQRALPSAPPDESTTARLLERLNRAESKFSELQSAVGLLVAAIERRPRMVRQST